MKYYLKDIENRQRVAGEYDKQLAEKVNTPKISHDYSSVWAQYSIRVNNRTEVAAKLKEAGIPTAIHYPKPLHLQECFDYLNLRAKFYYKQQLFLYI